MAARDTETHSAAVLLERFETVFYSEMDQLTGSSANNRLLEHGAKALRVPFASLIAGLDHLGAETRFTLLKSGVAVLVGAKDFRAPTGLGSVQSQYCYIVVLAKNSNLDLRNHFTKPPVSSAVAMPVWSWSLPLSEGESKPTPLHATQVAHSYLLVSNNLSELQAVAGQLVSAKDNRALSQIRDWKSISQHEVWGYRRYRHGQIHRHAAGMLEVAPTAEALILTANQKHGEARLQFLSSAPTDDSIERMNANGSLPPFRPVSARVWESVIPLSGDRQSLEWMVQVMGMFGFGLYL